MKQPIQTEKAPAAIGPYSQAIDSGAGLVFVSGQLPIDPATGAFPEGGVQEQTRQSLTNARSILEAAGLSLANVVKTTVFLADMADFSAMNEVYAQFFQAPFPARSAVAVKTLPKGALVEIECMAASKTGEAIGKASDAVEKAADTAREVLRDVKEGAERLFGSKKA